MKRTRRLVGVVTLVALAAIAVGVSGLELPLPRGGGAGEAQLPGVRLMLSDLLLRPGQGAPTDADLAFLAIEPSGNLIVSDQKRNTILRFDSSGHLLSEWGPRLGDVTLTQPAGVAVQGDSVYVLDRGTPRILRLDSTGTLMGTIDLQPYGTYGLNGLAVDAAGVLYAADTGRNRILQLSPSGDLLRQIGHSGTDLGGFTQPMNLAFAPAGSFAVVADWENGRLERFDATFQATDAWSTGFRPFGVAVDSLGRIYAPDTERRVIEAFSPRGASLGELGSASPTINVAPRQLAFSRTGDTALYALGSEGVARLTLENTAPPAQSAQDLDLLSLVIVVLTIGAVVVAFVGRRRRRTNRPSLRTLNGPVGLHAEDGAQRQDQQASANEHLLVANQPERESQSTQEHNKSDYNAEARHYV